ncbi:type II toxin-antitoxin system RelE/ParE family toxin [Pedobacter cryophilus]|uniref:Type II toxin-antitoxin system RelE/ParE family toxin n=1 Tax=Pedobacter cryophilus TaxID=2571271 RepID=A0A4U1BVU8_9SPHI|nr:type II toxin-antitoxin system RelE/ParE family toxin [Pedobacter cryophilus]TKB96969.1 type II toxin-antitoxin system RelE/ParE family toxin [Pedobacter cryophilus]
MAQRLIISSAAFDDFDRIIAFNNNRNHSEIYSKKIIKGLFDRFKKLAQNPRLGLRTSQANIYLLIWTDFYIYYKYTDQHSDIIIINVFHQKENI